MGQGVPIDPVLASTVIMSGTVGTVDVGGKQALLLQRLRDAFRKAQRANLLAMGIDPDAARPGVTKANTKPAARKA